MEKFFLASSVLDELEIKDLLLRRYGTLSLLDTMSIEEAISIIQYAKKSEREERYRQQWYAMLPEMSMYIPFQEFFDQMTGDNIDMRPVEVCMDEIDKIERRFESGT